MMEAIQMITSTPARILGVSNTKGSIVEGKDADLVLFDSDINIGMTIVQGTVVYNADNELKKNSLEITV
ncbi:isoaspartyl dipeptidase [compost metagenome]